ncbi:hypothetical protein ACRAWB_16725 [Leifsonia poae]|uniref:hypothetical protein n=1 Tax=Leifsonia poae TaxID=110933 RepID=UPI003D69C165
MGMDAGDAPLRQWRPVVVAVLLLLLHGVVAFALMVITLAYALSLDDTIGRDELYRLGPAFRWAMAGAFLPLPLAALAVWILRLVRARYVWVAPVAGMCASVVLCLVWLPFFHPEPVIGG